MKRLTIDIGNSRAKLTVFHRDEPLEETLTDNRALASLPELLTKHDISACITSSVIELPEETERMLERLPFPSLRLSPETRLPLVSILYRTPETLGTDRIAAVVGAVSRLPGRDILVIDAGTCITYDFVDQRGQYLGGNISPGLRLRLEAMHSGTSRLPLVNPYEGETPALGYDTETALRSGAARGIRHEMEGYIRELRAKYPSLAVFLTGGERFDLHSSAKSATFADRYLVARGLNKILEYNTK
ncbi:MAG: type III pantothenate kinase [Prevotellaceae bacterium]|nr:type III pantothenate kinase [Prevotellaceae bacterium]